MSFLSPSLLENQEYTRRAALAIQAADLLLAIKLMGLNRRMESLRLTMKADESTGGSVDAADGERYFELVRLKGHYESTEGCDELRMEILTEMFKKELEEHDSL